MHCSMIASSFPPHSTTQKESQVEERGGGVRDRLTIGDPPPIDNPTMVAAATAPMAKRPRRALL